MNKFKKVLSTTRRGKRDVQSNIEVMRSSTQLNHPSEVQLTILASDNKMLANSDNDDSLSGSQVISPPVFSASPSANLKENKISSSLSSSSFLPKIISSYDDAVLYAEDWGATHSSRPFLDDNKTSKKIISNPKNSTTEEEKEVSYQKPEKKLVDFGLRLVMLDKTMSGLGVLAFIWATVVLLGGFASTLKEIDFWFVSSIICIIGMGNFSRNHQLESRFFFQAAKVISGEIGIIITFFQFSSACVAITFSLLRLVDQNYGNKGEQITNMKAALNIFYAVALTNAFLFLIEKAYWFWTMSHLKIIEKVRDECGFGKSGVVSLRRFFHETYWKLSKGSVFHAVDLDLVTFAQGLLVSNFRGDQLIAVRILHGLVSHDQCSKDTCRRIRTSTDTMDRLVKMLSWHDNGEKAIQIYAAQIVAVLASKLQVESIPNAIDCISSLLEQEDRSELNLLGIMILRGLASNPMTCTKIIERTDLLSKIVEFTRYDAQIVPFEEDGLRMVEKSLMLLKQCVSTKGKAGQTIRRDISQFTIIVSNLRDILINGGTDPVLFKLAVDILTALSLDKAVRKKIGSTDGTISLLLTIYYGLSASHNEPLFRSKAGDSLAALTVQNERICSVILEEYKNFAHLLTINIHSTDIHQSITAMKILRNILAYSGQNWQGNLRQVTTELRWILKTIMSPETSDQEILEASIGLCVQILKFTGVPEFTRILEIETGLSIFHFAKMLLTILQRTVYPNPHFPSLRRHVIELVLWITESNNPVIEDLKNAGMKNVLVQTAKSTAEFENFHHYSGNFGEMEHTETISSLVSKAKVRFA